MRWARSWRADPLLVALADRHYTAPRRPRRVQMTGPPGRLVCLTTQDGGAGWISHWPKPELVLDGRDAWRCSFFRNERRDLYLSSDLVTEAIAATLDVWGEPPAGGFVTFIDEKLTRRKRDPGRCYRRAGFVPAGHTKDRGLLVLWLPVESFPVSAPALPRDGALFAA